MPVVAVAVVPAVLVIYRSNRKYHRAIHSYIPINGDKHSRNNCHWNYWLNRHDSHSDYWSNRKYHIGM
jgi:hypothetical protein